MGKISNWESHYGVPDEYFAGYYKIFDPDDAYHRAFGEDPDELDDIDVDEIVDMYFKMGPADEGYMEEVRQQWA